MKSNNLYSRLSIIVILLIMLGVSNNLHWGDENWRYTLDADAKGYFAYLPAVFVYHDLNYGFFDELEGDKYFIDSQHYDYRVKLNDKYTNKYFSGTALMITPFYLAAHLYSKLFGLDTDGYAAPYIVAVIVAALFYMVLGLFFLDKYLNEIKISVFNRILVLLALSFGTHLFNYSVVEPGFSHVYSFSLVCMFLYFIHNWIKRHSDGSFVIICFLLGLLALVRPVNILIALSIPFLAGGLSPMIKAINYTLQKRWTILKGLGIFALVLSVQIVINKLATGSFWVDTYPGEHFNFTSPHFWDVLFSYKKGLFIYTPLCFISLTGLFWLFKKSAQSTLFWLLFIVVVVFIISSWHNWWYGGSFSGRPFVEYLPFFMILLAYAVEGLKKKWPRILFLSAVVAFIIVNQIQTYQYRYYEIHYEDMDKEKYWDVFLRVDRLP